MRHLGAGSENGVNAIIDEDWKQAEERMHAK